MNIHEPRPLPVMNLMSNTRVLRIFCQVFEAAAAIYRLLKVVGVDAELLFAVVGHISTFIAEFSMFAETIKDKYLYMWCVELKHDFFMRINFWWKMLFCLLKIWLNYLFVLF